MTFGNDLETGVRMSLDRVKLGLVVCLILICTSCGDTFRPIVLPQVPTPPTPSANHSVFIFSNNGDFNPGSGMQVDVAGDSNVGVTKVGRGPVFATFVPPVPSHIAVANVLEDTVTLYGPANSAFNGGAPATVTLPTGAKPVFLNTTENNVVYSANSGNDTVSAIAVGTNNVTNTIALPAGSKPVSLAEIANGSKVYVVNQGTNSVQSINVVDKSLNASITDSTIDQPVWAVARADGQRVYVLSQGNGDVAVVDTSTDTLIPSTVSAGAGANFMSYDGKLNRLYITNPTAATVTILDANPDHLNVLATVPVTGTPGGIATLPDGSRAYVVSLQPVTSTVTAVVTVINTLNNSIAKTITLPKAPPQSVCTGIAFRVSIAAAADSSRVYVANCDAGGAQIIRTSDDSFQFTLPAPVSAAPAPPGSTQPPPQNPIWILAGP
jgi:YVTN family beta-propeller protein